MKYIELYRYRDAHDKKMIWETRQAIKVLDAKQLWPRMTRKMTQISLEGLRLLFEDPRPVWIDTFGKPWVLAECEETPKRGHIWGLPIWKLTSCAAHDNDNVKYFQDIRKKIGGNMRTTPTDVTDPAVPISWFTKHSYMSPGQALSLFLRDQLGMTWTDAGRLINKDECTIRRSYSYADQKKAAHDAKKSRRKNATVTTEKPDKPRKTASSGTVKK